ncbi:methylmalonyl Co-A mutase-associated GTPase MeaB [uncultured Dialister sp.]|jgi:LAO/AO transport system kinase|uniref:methylmalonyl Co-A mutase-associated GTPase MeaB n=1 Tax=uncultured Dialister sp. TaxID=278064 RepID=UPI0025EFD95E|nr:methylmalonyl Co-A mutase-associated GTPase MeaB [uncultured Dialister sp.]
MPENDDDLRPSWVPKEKNPEFACSVMRGIDSAVNSVTDTKYYPKEPLRRVPLRKKLSVEEYVEGVKRGDRMILAKAITLIESNAPKDFDKAQRVLQALLPRTGHSLRIGITGVPGAGKSTFIEAFGQLLCQQGYKVAVLAVDPTSSITGGSILGDKTRMQKLSREPNCFIRPSPSGGTLGGVARKSRETMMLCEAAGCNVILVETVGVGQSETTVRSMVDFFMLVVLTGAGDDLQGIKKGIMELADAIVVNKADGDNLERAKVTQGEYERMVEFIRPATEGWTTHAYRCSALKKTGLLELWAVMREFEKVTKKSGAFENRRKRQIISWVHTMIDEHLHNLFYEDPVIKGRLPEVKAAVLAGVVSPSQAVAELIRTFDIDRAAARQRATTGK